MGQIETETKTEKMNQDILPGAGFKELAEETLQILLQFSQELSKMATDLAKSTDEENVAFDKLVDGLQTLTDGIKTVKTYLDLGPMAHIESLEQGMELALTELLTAYQAGDSQKFNDTLTQLLVPNLDGWTCTGIPALIRSRDC